MNVSTKYVLQLIEKGGTETKFLDCTNRFYTLVPHDFGLKKPPLLNSADVIKVIFKNVFSVWRRENASLSYMYIYFSH